MNTPGFYEKYRGIMDKKGLSLENVISAGKLPAAVVQNMFDKQLEPGLEIMMILLDAIDMKMAEFFSEGETVFVLTEKEKTIVSMCRGMDAESLDRVLAYVQGTYDYYH